MNLLEVGKIINTHGLKGEVKVMPWTDTPDVFENIEYVYIEKKTGREKLTIKQIKYQKNNLIIKFQEIDTIELAEKYKEQVVYAEREMLGELPEGTHYIADLIGLTVVDENDNKIGIINDVLQLGGSDIYEIKREHKKDLLLPVIDEIVLNIDLEQKKVTVHIMEGLEDL